MFEPTIDIEPDSLSESSVFIRAPRFVIRLRTGERSPTTFTATDEKADRVASEIVTVIIHEVFEDAIGEAVREIFDEDKSAESSIRVRQVWLK